MIGRLVAIRLRGTLGALAGLGRRGDGRHPSRGRVVLFALLYAYLIGVCVFFSAMLGDSLIRLAQDAQALWLYFAVYTAAPLAVLFFLSIFETKSVLFESRDTERLLSLPIRPMDIVISRVLTVLAYNYGAGAVVMWPFLVVYAIHGGTPVGLLGGALVYLLLPILVTALASFVGFAVAWMSARVRHRTLASMVLYIAFFALYFYAYDALLSFVTEDVPSMDPSTLTDALGAGAPVLRFLGQIALLSPLPVLTLVLATVLTSALSLAFITRSFLRLSTGVAVGRRARAARHEKGRHSPLLALARKEFSRLGASALYMLNSGMGVLFTLLLAVGVCTVDPASVAVVLASFGCTLGDAPTLVAVALTAVSFTSMMSVSALSLEGKSLWLVRSIPVDGRTVLLAKCVPHVTVTTAASLMAGTVLSVALRASWWQALALLLLPVTANVASALIGIVLNTAMPKFDYTSEAEPIKQSLPVFLSMIGQLIVAAVLIGLCVVLTVLGLGWLSLLLTAGLMLALGALMYAVLCRVSAPRFEMLEF